MASRRVAIALGSNLGDRVGNLIAGLGELDHLLDALAVGPLFRSRPESRHERPAPPDTPDYLNTAATGWCRLEPEDLLAELKRCELAAGRRRSARDAPRALDLDLLLVDDLCLSRPELTVPHPSLERRLFVLAPLAEIAADWPVPPSGITVGTLLQRHPGGEGLEPVDWPGGDWRPRC